MLPALHLPPAPSLRERVFGVIALCLLVVPWLNPLAPGASAAVVPLMLGWLCAVGLLFILPWRWPSAAWLLLALAAAMALRGPWQWANTVPAIAGPALILLCAGFGAASMRGHARTTGLVVAALLLAALVSAVLALLQFFDLDRWFEAWGVINQASAGEAFANLRQRNHLASLMSIGLACLLWCAARTRVRGHAWWMLALLMAGSAASSSRTGLLQVVLIVALGGCWRGSLPRQERWLLAAALPVYFLAWLLEGTAGHYALGSAFERFAEGGQACTSRLVLWRNVLDLIAARPWMGWGWGELDFAHYAVLYRGERFCAILDNAHNLPLHLAVELGLPVALGFCALVAAAVWRARPWREANSTRQMAWMVVGVVALHSMLEYPLWYAYFDMALGLCLGMLWPGKPAPGNGPLPVEVTEPLPAAAPPGLAAADALPERWQIGIPVQMPMNMHNRNHGLWPRCLVALLLLGALAAVAWDYLRVSQVYRLPEDRWESYRDNTDAAVRTETWFFLPHQQFAEVTTAQIGAKRAREYYLQASSLLHFSPEPHLIEQVLRAAQAMGRADLVDFHLRRFRAAFPAEAADFEAREPAFSKPLPPLP